MIKQKHSLKPDFDLSAPSAVPRSVQGYNISSTIIRVTWTAPGAAEQNGIIVHYIISYRAVEGSYNDSTLRTKQVTGISRQADITGLEENVAYNITMLASTSIGVGPSSPAITVRTAIAGKTRNSGLYLFNLLSFLVDSWKGQVVFPLEKLVSKY